MDFFKKTSRLWFVLAILLAVLLCALNAVRIVNSIDHRNNDYFTFYLAGHMLIHGGDPYSPDQWVPAHEQFGVTWIPNQAFVYPLPLSLLFAPLALLPLYESYIVWVALSQVMILVSLYLLCRMENNPSAWRLGVLLLVGLVFFRPATLALVNGQLTAFLLLVLVSALILWNKGKWEWGALLLSLLMLKPNMGAPILLLLAVWLLFRKKFRILLALFLGGVILLVIGMLQDPAWALQYLGIGGGKVGMTFGYAPSVWGLASLVCGFQSPCTLAFGGSMTALLVIAAVWLFAFRPISAPLHVLSLSVTLALLITPYLWNYDQLLLLIPMAMLVFIMGRRKGGFLLAALFFLGVDFIAFLFAVLGDVMKMEILNAFIPLIVLLPLFCLLIPKEQPPKEPPEPVQGSRDPVA